ncbi:YjcZ family sporulation protein [Paenibacillus pinistramenti]|nr:YjcZ family sporulation protein [Paenibacillus pinistramenti]
MAYAAGGADSCASCAGNAFTNTGTILVLFILLVIISRTFWL